MSFWDIFRKKSAKKETYAADSNAGFVPLTTQSESNSPDTEAPSHGGNDVESATSTDSGTGSFGGDGGGASGGDGGGSAS